jgi:hypothetical protein
MWEVVKGGRKLLMLHVTCIDAWQDNWTTFYLKQIDILC